MNAWNFHPSISNKSLKQGLSEQYAQDIFVQGTLVSSDMIWAKNLVAFEFKFAQLIIVHSTIG